MGREVWFGYHNRRSVETLPLYGRSQMPILITLVNLKEMSAILSYASLQQTCFTSPIWPLSESQREFCLFSLYLFWFRLADYLLKSGARIARKVPGYVTSCWTMAQQVVIPYTWCLVANLKPRSPVWLLSYRYWSIRDLLLVMSKSIFGSRRSEER